jgi:hypothetical protein
LSDLTCSRVMVESLIRVVVDCHVIIVTCLFGFVKYFLLLWRTVFVRPSSVLEIMDNAVDLSEPLVCQPAADHEKTDDSGCYGCGLQ